MCVDGSEEEIVDASSIGNQKGFIVSHALFKFIDTKGIPSEDGAIGTGVFISVWFVDGISIEPLTFSCHNQIFQ